MADLLNNVSEIVAGVAVIVSFVSGWFGHHVKTKKKVGELEQMIVDDINVLRNQQRNLQHHGADMRSIKDKSQED